MRKKTKLKDLILIQHTSYKDKRGYFKELLKEKDIKKNFPLQLCLFQKKM